MPQEANMQGQAAVRRRRTPQNAGQRQTSEPAVYRLPQEKNAAHTPEGKIPRLPHEDVHVDEEPRRSPRQEPTRRKADAVRMQSRLRSASGKTYPAKAAKGAATTAAVAGKAAVSGGKTALGWLGGALLLLGMGLTAGVQKLRSLIEANARGSRKKRLSEEGHAPAADDYVLEAIRPEDYHGKAQMRGSQGKDEAQQAEKYAYRKGGHGGGRPPRRPDAQQLLSLVFAGVAIFSACMIVSILWRTVRTNRTNKQLAQLYAQAGDEAAATQEAPQQTPEVIVFMPEEMQTAYEEPEQTGANGGEKAAQSAHTPQPVEAAQQTENKAQPEATVVPMGQRIYHQVGGDALPQMEALYNENRDTVGWLQIENVLDLPVVYRDNDYYLKRDFYKQKNTAGTIFLDVNHPFKAKTQNLLLHGHNMKDGTMFGRLIQYETDLNYVRWHPFVKFDTLWRKEEYVIFAVLRVSLDVRSEEFFNYFSHPTFASDAEFEAYIRQLQLRSLYAIPVDVKPTDALLTLSTCLEEDRLVIVARRVRSGETHTDLRAITNLTTRQ